MGLAAIPYKVLEGQGALKIDDQVRIKSVNPLTNGTIRGQVEDYGSAGNITIYNARLDLWLMRPLAAVPGVYKVLVKQDGLNIGDQVRIESVNHLGSKANDTIMGKIEGYSFGGNITIRNRDGL